MPDLRICPGYFVALSYLGFLERYRQFAVLCIIFNCIKDF